MKVKFFNKTLVAFVLLLTLFVIGVKIHSMFTYPRIHDWNYWQLKRFDHKMKNFSFTVFADNKNSIKTFNHLIEKVNNENCLFSIDIGDLVYDGEKEKFRFFINQIKKSKKPLLTVIGNHEIKDNGRGNYYDFFGRFYYSFTVGESYFIILDDANERNLDPWQLEWLKKELDRSLNYRYRFIFMHVPLYDPRKGKYAKGHSLTDLRFARKLNEIFDHYNITMLFTSHIHAYYRGMWRKTPYIITGGAGAELAGANPEHYFYHYLTVHVSKDGISYKVTKLKSPDFELFDRLIHDAWIYIYAFFAIHFLDIIIFLGLFYLAMYVLFYKKKFLFWKIEIRKG